MKVIIVLSLALLSACGKSWKGARAASGFQLQAEIEGLIGKKVQARSREDLEWLMSVAEQEADGAIALAAIRLMRYQDDSPSIEWWRKMLATDSSDEYKSWVIAKASTFPDLIPNCLRCMEVMRPSASRGMSIWWIWDSGLHGRLGLALWYECKGRSMGSRMIDDCEYAMKDVDREWHAMLSIARLVVPVGI